MDNAQKAIMIGVGLFITIIIISAVMLITSAGQDLMNNSMNELNNISDSLSRQLYSDFAGGTFTGSEVIAAVKKYTGQEGLTVTVYTDSAKKNSKPYTSTNIGTVSSDVISTAKYSSEVTLDGDSQKVTAITFTRK